MLQELYANFDEYTVDQAFTIPLKFCNFHSGSQYNEEMKLLGDAMGFTMSTTQGGKDYEMIGYNFDQLILRTHKDGRDHDIRIQPKDKSLDLDVFHSCKPNSKTNVVTTTIIAHDLTARQVEAIRNFLYKPNKL